MKITVFIVENILEKTTKNMEQYVTATDSINHTEYIEVYVTHVKNT